MRPLSGRVHAEAEAPALLQFGVRDQYARRGIPHPETRKVERPSYEQLQADVAALSMVAAGRKYGVSANGVRKWLRWYERARERTEVGSDS
jgi:hypothetical protein